MTGIFKTLYIIAIYNYIHYDDNHKLGKQKFNNFNICYIWVIKSGLIFCLNIWGDRNDFKLLCSSFHNKHGAVWTRGLHGQSKV